MIFFGGLSQANPPVAPGSRFVRSLLLGLLLVCAAFRSAWAADPSPDRVDVLYFHRTARCHGCLDMEAFAAEAVARFPAEREAGRLTWRAINLDDPDQRHFEQDYALEFNSVVLSRRASGREEAWTNLPAVWPLVGDRSNFVAYVEMEIGAQLDRLPAAGAEVPQESLAGFPIDAAARSVYISPHDEIYRPRSLPEPVRRGRRPAPH